MSEQFEQIKEGMLQAISHAKGRTVPGMGVHHPKPVDVKALRLGIGMTQEQFAAKFGVSTATLRQWERGDRSPHGPALVLLNVIKHNPKAVIKALAR
jgi:putative transcriptional regulator